MHTRKAGRGDISRSAPCLHVLALSAPSGGAFALGGCVCLLLPDSPRRFPRLSGVHCGVFHLFIGEEDAVNAKGSGEHTLREFSRYSYTFAIVPRWALSESFLQTAQEKFKGAALEAIEKVENNHSMDEMLLRVAKMELSAFVGNEEGSGDIDNGYGLIVFLSAKRLCRH